MDYIKRFTTREGVLIKGVSAPFRFLRKILPIIKWILP